MKGKMRVLLWGAIWPALGLHLLIGAASMVSSADKDGDKQLITAAGRGDTAAVARLLKQGASVHARDRNGVTALIAAAYQNHSGSGQTFD
jgi:hypothetical protein